MTETEYFFQKHEIDKDDVIYVYRSNKRSMVCEASGKETPSLTPVHLFLDYLADKDFISISKGVIVRRDKISFIDDEGVYTMIDGRSFQGRKRYLSAHKKLRKSLELDATDRRGSFYNPTEFKGKFSVLDDMPIAYCAIELVFDKNGHGIDFIFRYCNKQMAIVEGVPVDEMLDRSFYEVFKNGDKKWLVTYADVALNGTIHTLHDYSPEIDKNLTIYCYQPEPGFCACVIFPED